MDAANALPSLYPAPHQVIEKLETYFATTYARNVDSQSSIDLSANLKAQNFSQIHSIKT
jgi:hypothetical protein